MWNGAFAVPKIGFSHHFHGRALTRTTAHLLAFLRVSLKITTHENYGLRGMLIVRAIQLNECFFFILLRADIFVRATLVQLIPEIYARCIELGHPELDFYLFDRMLEITLRFLKNEENMVSGTNSMLRVAWKSIDGIYLIFTFVSMLWIRFENRQSVRSRRFCSKTTWDWLASRKWCVRPAWICWTWTVCPKMSWRNEIQMHLRWELFFFPSA